MEKGKRNESLDVIKLIASFMVVFIHVNFYGRFGEAVDAVARYAVPLFFSVSGFFALNADAKTIKKRVLKTLFLYLVAATLYHIFEIILTVHHGGASAVVEYFSNRFLNVRSYILFFFFNVPFSYIHLWFLLAQIYVYLIWLLIIKFSVKDKVVFILSLCLLFTHLLLGEFLSFFGKNISVFFVRNFALMGFPFFALGYLANKYKNKLLKIKYPILIVMLVLGVVESIFSRFIFLKNELYIGSICCCFSLLVIAIKSEEKNMTKSLVQLSTTSTDIYLYHIIISSIGSFVLNTIKFPITAHWFINIWPLAVICITIVFSLLKRFLKKKLKELRKKCCKGKNLMLL